MERLSLLLLLLLEAQAGRRQWSTSLSFQLSRAPPGTRVGSGHADVKERTGCSHPAASTHPSDTSPMPSTVLGATRSSGDVAQEEV